MLPFTGDGLWLRCALHAHTTNSDGDLAPEALVRHYDWAGYDVLAITDHWVRTVERSTPGLLVIPSIELNALAGDAGDDAHVLALGVASAADVPESEFSPLADVVAWIAGEGGVPIVAHPYWSGLRTEQWESCPGLAGVEIWNAGCQLELGRGDSTVHWDEALERGRPLLGIATDDSHHPAYDSGHAWTMVRARERSSDAVLEAIRSGSFYASAGPTIHSVEVTDESVAVVCSPAAGVTLFCGGRRGARVNAGRLGYPYQGEILQRDDRGLITACRLERPWDAAYGRVEVADADGHRAWTNPLWIT